MKRTAKKTQTSASHQAAGAPDAEENTEGDAIHVPNKRKTRKSSGWGTQGGRRCRPREQAGEEYPHQWGNDGASVVPSVRLAWLTPKLCIFRSKATKGDEQGIWHWPACCLGTSIPYQALFDKMASNV